jgi:hypothetical protein
MDNKLYSVHVLGWAIFTNQKDTELLPVVGYSLGGPQIDGIKGMAGYRLTQIIPATTTYKICCKDEDCTCDGEAIGYKFPGDDTDWNEAQRIHAKVRKSGYKLGQELVEPLDE